MSKIAVIYGSSTGNTEAVAESIVEKIGNGAEAISVDSVSADQIAGFDNLILGTSTWGLGDLQDDWEVALSKVAGADLNGKKVALFGLGDGESYPDTFVDGIGTIYNEIKDKGCTIIGQVEAEGYSYDESTALVDGKFIGLPLDDDNESHLTSERIDKWLKVVIPAFS